MKLAADQVGFPIGSRAHVLVNLLKTGQDCSGADYGLTSNRILNFFFYKNVFFLLCFEYMAMIETQNRRQKKNFKVKILPFPGLV